MRDKHSLAEEKPHSLSEEARPLDAGKSPVGFKYPEEDINRELYHVESGTQEKWTKGFKGFVIFMVVTVEVFVGTVVFIETKYGNETATSQPPADTTIDYKSLEIPPLLDGMTETTNGVTGREMVLTREFIGTVVGYASFDMITRITFSINGAQQAYIFRSGNEGVVVKGTTYKVKIQYWHSYWDFVTVEQIK